jgi:hypothetical protein
MLTLAPVFERGITMTMQSLYIPKPILLYHARDGRFPWERAPNEPYHYKIGDTTFVTKKPPGWLGKDRIAELRNQLADVSYVDFHKKGRPANFNCKGGKKGRNPTKNKPTNAKDVLIVATRMEIKHKVTSMSYAFGLAAEDAIIEQGKSPVQVKEMIRKSMSKKKDKPLPAIFEKHKRTTFKPEPGWELQDDGTYIKAKFWDRGPENVQEHKTYMDQAEQAIYDNFVTRKESEVHCG